ncbi:MAG: hypothetical protein IPK68_03995 [Bdellovibrionales bacterium]|nr:hypothetical protein [Bdellovibrionales bacterium]
MNVSDELLYELLVAWEGWTGPASGFYSAIGADHRKMAKLIGRAKRLKREGVFPSEEFKEIKISDAPTGIASGPCQGMEILWDNGKIIRFSQVEYAGPQKLDRLLRYKKYVFVACPERGFNSGRDQKKAYA